MNNTSFTTSGGDYVSIVRIILQLNFIKITSNIGK
jgi:hypothetical protein